MLASLGLCSSPAPEDDEVGSEGPISPTGESQYESKCITQPLLVAGFETKKVKVKSLSCIRLFATLWTVAHQAPPSMEFSRQEYWSGLPYPSPEDLPDPGIEHGSPALWADALPSEPPGKPKCQARSWRQLGSPEIALHPSGRERWAWRTRGDQSTSQDIQQVGPAEGSMR